MGNTGTQDQPATAGSLALISRQVLAAPAATVTFAAIPATFENLKLVVMGAVSDAATFSAITMLLNGDNAAHYRWAASFPSATGDNFTGSAGTAASATLGRIAGSTAPAGAADSFATTFPSYARTVLIGKSFFTAGHNTQIGDGSQLGPQRSSGLWIPAAATAINSIALTDGGGGNFITGSVFSLYGES